MPRDNSPPPLSAVTKAFGERVRERRRALGLSQEALATAAGLHWTFIGQVERGRRNLSLHNIVKVAAALQVNPAALVDGLRPAEATPTSEAPPASGATVASAPPARREPPGPEIAPASTVVLDSEVVLPPVIPPARQGSGASAEATGP